MIKNSPPPKRVLRSIIGACSTVALISGCSLLQPASDEMQDQFLSVDRASISNNNDELVSVDLVNALIQVNTYSPDKTIIKLSNPKDKFGVALTAVLENAGYALRFVDTKGGSDFLEHSVVAGAVESTGRHQTYEVSLGDIRLKRQYFIQDQGVTPSSNLYVQGTDPTQIALNDALFETGSNSVPQPEPEPTTTLKTAEAKLPGLLKISDGAVRDEKSVPTMVASLRVPAINGYGQTPTESLTRKPLLINKKPAETDVVKKPADAADTSPEIASPAPSGAPALAGIVKQNMYELGASNFAEATKDYYDVRKHTLIFGNDSLRIGNDNRAMLRQFINGFEEEHDVLSVIGCSHGRTALSNGNAVLATGRANRVKEALMYAGIPHEKILEEGCWASEHFDEVMPRRGVVLTLKRQNAKG